MDKVSIIIPARGENSFNLKKTLQSIYENVDRSDEFEIIVGFNGKPYIEDLGDFPKVIYFPENIGIKGSINALAATATGKYLFKLDAHCAISKNFNTILQQDMQDDWVVTPRFKIIKDDWSIQMRDGQEEFYDYFYLSCPFTDPRGLRFKAGGHWKEKTIENLPFHDVSIIGNNRITRGNYIDETPQIHGSGWFMTKDRFFELGGFPLQDPYGHGQEPLWLGLRNWLMGGKVMVNKNTWYAHLHQNSSERGYPEDKAETERTYKLVAEHFLENKGHYLHDFAWFVEKFMPMPGWENWKEQYAEYLRLHS